MELTKLQEATRQAEFAAKVKEYDVHIEQSKIQQKQIEGEEKRKSLQEETKQHQMRAQYQDQLARKRFVLSVLKPLAESEPCSLSKSSYGRQKKKKLSLKCDHLKNLFSSQPQLCSGQGIVLPALRSQV